MGLIPLLMAFDQGEKPDVANHLLRISEEHNPLRELMDYLSKDLPFTPDVILLDARTGITQLSGPRA